MESTIRESSSSRRTWIEIETRKIRSEIQRAVVLLAEDVDRNTLVAVAPPPLVVSSSSRRTWIEIWGT